MRFGGRVLEARGLWCSVSERGGRVWKSSVSDRERAREEVRGDEHILGSGGGGRLGWLVVYSLGTSWTGRFFGACSSVSSPYSCRYIVLNCLLIKK